MRSVKPTFRTLFSPPLQLGTSPSPYTFPSPSRGTPRTLYGGVCTLGCKCLLARLPRALEREQPRGWTPSLLLWPRAPGTHLAPHRSSPRVRRTETNTQTCARGGAEGSSGTRTVGGRAVSRGTETGRPFLANTRRRSQRPSEPMSRRPRAKRGSRWDSGVQEESVNSEGSSL